MLDKPIIRIKDMTAISRNYHYFSEKAVQGGRAIAPVLKSNAYGFGIKDSAEILYQSGARLFFTSDVYEAGEISAVLPHNDVSIYTLHGYNASAGLCLKNVYPVLNSHEEYRAYSQAVQSSNMTSRAAILQFDTGMNRNGFCLNEAKKLSAKIVTGNVDIAMYMTHLCHVDLDYDSEQQASMRQLKSLERFLGALPEKPLSVTATHGSLYLQHRNKMPIKQDVERIGVGLFGDIEGQEYAFKAKARILSVQNVTTGEKIGYSGRYTARRDMRLAVIDIGYGDGYPRECSVTDDCADKKSYMTIGKYRAPVVGLVAMNMTCVDVTDIPEVTLAKENYVDIIGPDIPIHHIAECANMTIEDICISLNRHNVRARDVITNEIKYDHIN